MKSLVELVRQAKATIVYRFGLGVRRDTAEAARLYSQATFGSHAAAQINLALLYASGENVEKHGELAYAWLNMARRAGSPVAQDDMSALLRDHRVRHQLVGDIRARHATLSSFPRLH